MKQLFLILLTALASNFASAEDCTVYIRIIGSNGASSECGTHFYSLESSALHPLILERGYRIAGYSNFPNSKFCSMFGVDYSNLGLNWQTDFSKPAPWSNKLLLIYAPWSPLYTKGQRVNGIVELYEMKNDQARLLYQNEQNGVAGEEYNSLDGAAKAIRTLPRCQE